MANEPFETSDAKSLMSLMRLAAEPEEAKVPWRKEDLAAVLRHQLAAPLQADLATVAFEGEKGMTQLMALAAGSKPIASFADLISRPRPPLELVRCMKDYAKSARGDGTLPVEVATLLYYASLAVAAVRCGTNLTELDDAALANGLRWGIAQPWGGDAIHAVLREHLARLTSGG